MKILVFGRDGQLSTELERRLPDAIFAGLDEADFTDPDACLSVLDRVAPDVVINASAYTAVDRAEEDEALATQINATTPGLLAARAADTGAPFLHVSTDYVFDGAGQTPFAADADPAPLGAYGRSKALGEGQVTAAGGVPVVLRTSWVFSAHGGNFVKTMLRLGAERDELRVVDDQVGGPTSARAIADALARIAERPTAGIYNFSGAPDVSWAGFAEAIFAKAGLDCAVQRIPTTDYPTPAVRPLNSRLDCSLTEATFGISRPDWRWDLDDVLKELGHA